MSVEDKDAAMENAAGELSLPQHKSRVINRSDADSALRHSVHFFEETPDQSQTRHVPTQHYHHIMQGNWQRRKHLKRSGRQPKHWKGLSHPPSSSACSPGRHASLA